MPARRRWKSTDLAVGVSGKLEAKKVSAPASVLAPRNFSGLVLGVDPSLRGTGLALVRCEGGKMTLLYSQTLKTKGDANTALGEISLAVGVLCKKYRPDASAVEEAIFAQNHRTAITLGAARGAILATLAMHDIVSLGYPPTRIKQAVVGTGRASKEQVAAMTRRLLSLPAALPFDEADAAAAALCHIFTHRG